MSNGHCELIDESSDITHSGKTKIDPSELDAV